MSNQSFKVKNGLTLTPVDPSTLVSPQTGDLICDSTDNNKIKKYDAVNSVWSEVSSSTDLNAVFQLIADDVSQWSTGNNATFLGGGTIAGTFVADSSTPLNGVQSYKYTQAAGSLNDYFVSAAQPVALRFRGVQTTLYFPYTYNGSNNDIEVIVYDTTNSAIIQNSAFVQASANNAIFKTNITIPLTCTSIRVGFATRVANTGKILAFDDVQLTSDTTVYAALAQTETIEALTSTSTFGSTNTGVPVLTITKNTLLGVIAVDSTAAAGTSFRALKKCTVSLSTTGKDTTTAATIYITRNATILTAATPDGILATQSIPVGFSGSTTSSVVLDVGDVLRIQRDATSITSIPSVTLTAVAASSQILTAPETFSTDTAALAYSSTYTLSTLNTAPVGTYITFTYAANTNTRTQTSTRPTQTDADMNTNGIQIFTRAYNAASTAASPAAIAIQIGKGLKGRSLDLYKSAGKVTAGSLDAFNETSTVRSGAVFKEYNQQTGILIVDVGYCINTTITSSLFYFSDVTTATNGYLVINASKNPALTGLDINAVGSRYTSTAGGSIAITDTVQTFATKDYDTNSAFSGTTFTAPVAGYYQIDGQIATAAVTLTTSQSLAVRLYLNGAIKTTGITNGVGVNLNYFCRISDIYFLRAGDTVQLQAASSVATTQWTGIGNFLSIVKVSV